MGKKKVLHGWPLWLFNKMSTWKWSAWFIEHRFNPIFLRWVIFASCSAVQDAIIRVTLDDFVMYRFDGKLRIM